MCSLADDEFPDNSDPETQERLGIVSSPRTHRSGQDSCIEYAARFRATIPVLALGAALGCVALAIVRPVRHRELWDSDLSQRRPVPWAQHVQQLDQISDAAGTIFHEVDVIKNTTGEWSDNLHGIDGEVAAVENVTGSWLQNLESWWNQAEHGDELDKTVKRGKELQEQMEKGIQSGYLNRSDMAGVYRKHRLRQQMTHLMHAGWVMAGNISSKADIWKSQIAGILGQSTEGDRCDDLDGLYIERVIHNNLGGQGPDHGGEESLILAANHSENGTTVQEVAYKITAMSKYTAGWTHMNGLSHGLVGKYGQVTLRAGTSVTLKIQSVDLRTQQVIHQPSAVFTFFDLDEGTNHSSSEYITVRGPGQPGGFTSVETTATTEVRNTTSPDGTVTYRATTLGTFDDNPVDPLLLTEQQRNRAVTFRFQNVDEITVVIGAAPSPRDPMNWRCFSFVGHPVLKCAVRLQKHQVKLMWVVYLAAGLIGCFLFVWCLTCCCG